MSCYLCGAGESLGVSCQALAAGLEPPTLVGLSGCRGAGRLAGEAAHSDRWRGEGRALKNKPSNIKPTSCYSSGAALGCLVPLCDVGGGAGSPAPHAAARGGVAGLGGGQQGAGVGGHGQGEQPAQRHPVEASGQEEAAGPARHGQRHRAVDRVSHSRTCR